MTAELLAHNVVAHWLQAGLVTGVAGLGIAVLRLRRPGFLLRYWQAVLLLLLVAPWIQPWQPVAAAPAADLTPISGMEQAFDGGDGVSVAGRVIALPAARWRVAPWTWVLGLLAAGVIVRLGWIGLGLLRLARLARAADRIAPPAVARELLARFRVSAAFVQHPEVRMPCSFGLFRPTVMMPAAFDRLEPAFQRAIICHELLHIKRRDFARVVVEDVAAALLWFHPWVWLLRRRIRLHREQVVDAEVVRGTGDRCAYVRCLVELAGHPLTLRLASPMLRSSELRTRTDALFEKEGTMSTRRSAVVATGLCVALGATVWTAAATTSVGAAERRRARGSAADDGRRSAAVAVQARDRARLHAAKRSPAADPRVGGPAHAHLVAGRRQFGVRGENTRRRARDRHGHRDRSRQRSPARVGHRRHRGGWRRGAIGTFQTSVPFQIAVPRIVTFDPAAAAQLRAAAMELRGVQLEDAIRERIQASGAFARVVQPAVARLGGLRVVASSLPTIAVEQQGAILQAHIEVIVEQLNQAVASISGRDLLEGGDTTADEMQVRLAMLTARVAQLQLMVLRFQTQLQVVGVPER